MRALASVRSTRIAAVAAALALGAACAASAAQAGVDCHADNMTRVVGGGECLVVATLEAAPGNRTLVVFVHGGRERSRKSMDYMSDVAWRIAGAGVTAAVLMRPGFRDYRGSASTARGKRGARNWFAYDVVAVAEAVASLKDHHGAQRVVLVGHSIGAAIVGVILGRNPGLADAAVLASCPCNMISWKHGIRRLPRKMSPHGVVDAVPVDSVVIALTGNKDRITRPRLARDYVAALAKRGVAATFIELAGADHNLQPLQVRKAVNGLVDRS